MNALEVNAVTKRFGNKEVLRDVSFQVPEHSLFGFIGQNGAGKTTTMKAVLGLLKPDSGEIRVFGEPVTYGNTKTNRMVGYLPDVPEFYGYMTTREYLRLCGEIAGVPGKELKPRIEEILTTVGLEAEKHRIKGFSRGMKQRLGIAQALLHKPKLLICDEPTSALDPLGRKEILDALLAAKKETTVIFSTHILSDVERVCDRAAMLHNGVVTLDGTMEELHSRKNGERFCIVPKDQETYDVLSSMFLPFETLLTEKGERDVPALLWRHADEEDFRNVLTCVAEKKLSIEKAEWLGTTLEDMFLEVVRS